MRKYITQNEILKNIYVTNKENQVEIGKKLDEMEKINKQIMELGKKIQKGKDLAIKESNRKKIEKEMQLTEFEYITKFYAEDNNVVFEIEDKVEEYKEALRKK